MKSLLFVAVFLLTVTCAFAQQPNPKVQEALDAGIVVDLEENMAYLNHAVDNVYRVFPTSKAGSDVLPANELTHKVTGAVILEADLENFNPLMWNIQTDNELPTYYSVGQQTLMLLSENRLETLFKRHEINRQAAEKRNAK